MQLTVTGVCSCIIHILIFLSLSACTSQEEKLTYYIEKGEELIEANDMERALSEFRTAVDLFPDSSRARYVLGKYLQKNNQLQDSFRELLHSVQLDPSNIDAQLALAEALFGWKEYEKCQKKIEDILRIKPVHIKALELLTNLHLARDNSAAALKSIVKALDLEPDNDRLHKLKAEVLFFGNDYKYAEEAFKKALALAPEDLDNYRAIASFYIASDNPEAAEEQIHAMISRLPKSTDAYLVMSEFYHSISNDDLALMSIEKAMELDDKNAKVIAALASYYKGKKEYQKAEEKYRAALELESAEDSIKLSLADLYFEVGEYDKCAYILDTIGSNFSDMLDTQVMHAKLMIQNGKLQAGEELIDNILQSKPDYPEASFVKAVALAKQHKNIFALSAAKDALKIKKDHSNARLLLAELYFAERDIDKAKEEAIKVLRLDSSNQRAAMIISKCLIFDDHFDASLSILEGLKLTYPDETAIYQALGVAYLGKGKMNSALECFKKVLGNMPSDSVALEGIVTVFKDQNRLDEAWKIVATQKQENPANFDLLLLYATIAMQMEKYDVAENSLRSAMQIKPNQLKSYLLLGLIHRKTGKIGESIIRCAEVLKIDPDLNSVRMEMAVLLERAGRYDEAAENYRRILSYDKTFAPAANNLAWYLIENTENVNEALCMAMVAKSIVPDDAYVSDTLGWVYYSLGEYDLALQQFNQAMEKLSGNPSFNFHMALALDGLKKKKKAYSKLKRALLIAERGGHFPEIEKAEKMLASNYGE